MGRFGVTSHKWRRAEWEGGKTDSGSDFSSGTLCSGPPEGWGWVRVGLSEWVTC